MAKKKSDQQTIPHHVTAFGDVRPDVVGDTKYNQEAVATQSPEINLRLGSSQGVLKTLKGILLSVDFNGFFSVKDLTYFLEVARDIQRDAAEIEVRLRDLRPAASTPVQEEADHG